jgi:uncharacterized protein (TIGR02246 family)
MLLRSATILSLGLILFSTGCQQAPADTHEADVKAIRDLETAWMQAFNTRDSAKVAVFYADDATVLIPNAPAFNGVDAIKGAFKSLLDDPNFKLSFSATKVDVAKSGDLAYTQGSYTMTTTDPATKNPADEKGKYLTVYRKQADGKWKGVEDTFMTDAPAPAPAPATQAKRKTNPKRAKK